MTLAKLAGIKNWEKFKNHSWRSYAITKMNSSGKVTLTESMGAARHLSSNTHAKYIRNSGGTELARLQVLAGVAYIDVDLTDGKQKPSEKRKKPVTKKKAVKKPVAAVRKSARNAKAVKGKASLKKKAVVKRKGGRK